MKHITTLLLMIQLGLLAGLAQTGFDPFLVWPLAYQGTLSSNGVAVTGPHDIVLSLWAGPVGGTQIGASITNTSVVVADGQFAVLLNGLNVADLSRTNVWLEPALRRSGSGAPFVTLLPRQRLASVPRAAVAERALTISPDALSVANLGSNTVDGAILGHGSVGSWQIASSQVVMSLNGLRDHVTLNAGDGLLLSAGTNNTLTLSKSNIFNCSDYDQCYWTLLGNTGTTPPGPQTDFPAPTDNWVGTTDRTALELRVNTWRGLRLQPYLPSPVDPINRTVSVIGGYSQNVVNPGVYAATIAGGGSQTGFNTVNGSYGTVGGGSGNTAGTFPGGVYATVGGGSGNLASGYVSTVAGGASNLASGYMSSVVGGNRNSASSKFSAVGGGDTNRIQVDSDSATIGGGQWNLIQNAAPFANVSGGRFNKAGANAATIGGGAFNTNSGSSSTISGGDFNVIPSGAAFTTVAGGRANVAGGVQSVIGGGQLNRTTTTGSAAVVGGGFNNEASGESSTIAGGVANLTASIATYATIGGGAGNNANAIAASIGGGISNTNLGISSTIGGGEYNFIQVGADRATVAGGHLNFASGSSATVGGGSFNTAVAPNSTIPGGLQARTGSYGQQAYASGQFVSSGDAQGSLYVLRTNTSSTAQSELFLDGGFNNQRMNVPVGATWDFSILVAARNGVAGGNQSGGWEIRGVVQNIGGTVSLLCSTITTNCATLVGTPFVQALNPQQALVIKTKDQLAFPTRWVASVRTAEVIAP